MSSVEGPRISSNGGDWSHPTCSRIAQNVKSGDGWVTGTVGATCALTTGELVIDATYDCGVIDRPSHGKKS